MKKISFWAWCFIISLKAVAATPDTSAIEKALAIVQTVKMQYAPDPRTEVLVATVLPDSTSLIIEYTNSAAIKAIEQQMQYANLPIQIKKEPLPAKDLAAQTYAVVDHSICTHRFAPANAAEWATQSMLGTPLDVLKHEKGFYLVRTPDGYLSWVNWYGIHTMNAEQFHTWQQAPKIIYTADYGHSYEKPTCSSGYVSDIIAGNMLECRGKKKGFYEVVYPDGRTGFVSAKEAKPFNAWCSLPNPDAAAVLATAHRFIGVPYVWGGASMKGLDCSGFTKLCYFLNGVILPRDASQQALEGEAVDIYEADSISIDKCLQHLQPGDLLFFAEGKGKVNNPRITHVGMYIGNGTFIHSGGGLVQINSFLPDAANYDASRKRTLVSARRILTSIGKGGIVRVDHHQLYISQR